MISYALVCSNHGLPKWFNTNIPLLNWSLEDDNQIKLITHNRKLSMYLLNALSSHSHWRLLYQLPFTGAAYETQSLRVSCWSQTLSYTCGHRLLSRHLPVKFSPQLWTQIASVTATNQSSELAKPLQTTALRLLCFNCSHKHFPRSVVEYPGVLSFPCSGHINKYKVVEVSAGVLLLLLGSFSPLSHLRVVRSV